MGGALVLPVARLHFNRCVNEEGPVEAIGAVLDDGVNTIESAPFAKHRTLGRCEDGVPAQAEIAAFGFLDEGRRRGATIWAKIDGERNPGPRLPLSSTKNRAISTVGAPQPPAACIIGGRPPGRPKRFQLMS